VHEIASLCCELAIQFVANNPMLEKAKFHGVANKAASPATRKKNMREGPEVCFFAIHTDFWFMLMVRKVGAKQGVLSGQ
jgi:hypothetical protein